MELIDINIFYSKKGDIMTKKKEARQIRIQKILLERTKVKISDLAKELNVTPETLRNDLNEMENLSLLVREHGYARVISSSFETPLTMRNRENPEDKRRITFRAFQEIKDGQIVYLDSGSTVLLGANALQMKKDITVVTNSIPLLTHCIAMNINTIVCGGFLFNTGARTYGHFAANIIDHLHIDVAIMGTDGILDSNGFTTMNSNELSLKRHVMNQTKKLIAVCDGSKFYTSAPYIFCKFKEFDMLITNKLTDEQRKMVQDIKEVVEV